jgi:hypothetical protein
MEERDAIAEPGGEARDRLGGERDLRNQDDRSAPALERRLRRGG